MVRMSLRQGLRTLYWAFWVGWQIESNWASPFAFAVFSLVKPLSSTLLVVVMYLIVSGGKTSSPLFSYIYLGNAFFVYVMGILMGMGEVVFHERERFQTIKSLCITPLSLFTYLLGRGIVKLLTCSISVAITLLFGVWFLHLQIGFSEAQWGWLWIVFPAGLLGIGAIGVILAGFSFLMAQHSFFYIGESISGSLYFLCGVLYPLTTLPEWLRKISYLLPVTYWLEAMRRLMLKSSVASGVESYSLPFLVLVVVLSSFLALALSYFLFSWLNWLARKKGVIDLTTAY